MQTILKGFNHVVYCTTFIRYYGTQLYKTCSDQIPKLFRQSKADKTSKKDKYLQSLWTYLVDRISYNGYLKFNVDYFYTFVWWYGVHLPFNSF